MVKKQIDPGLIRVFRYFTLVSIFYFSANVIYTMLETGKFLAFPQLQALWNLWISLVLFLYLSIGYFRRLFGKYYLPLALTISVISPILSNIVYFPAFLIGQRSYVEGGIGNIFPILFIPLVIMAWQYGFKYVWLFLLGTTLTDMLLVYSAVGVISFSTLPVYTIPMIRAFAFGMVGHVIHNFNEIQGQQKKALIAANIELHEHARTIQQLTISRERNRLARDLHDTLAHTLSGLSVNLEAIKLKLSGDQDGVMEMIETSLENTRQGLQETRRALRSLRSKPLEEMGLRMALEDLVQGAALQNGINVECEIAPLIPELPAQVEETIFWISREAMTNIRRHADARNISLRLMMEDRNLRLCIQDDGKGFEITDPAKYDSLGIKGMKERAALLGADFSIESQPDVGTKICMTVEDCCDKAVDL